MTAKIGIFEKEGFVSAYLIKFENGLILRSEDVLWAGKDKTEDIKQKFMEVVNNLKELGINIT